MGTPFSIIYDIDAPNAIFFNIMRYGNESVVIPVDQGNFALTQEEWENVRQVVDKYFEIIPQQVIENHNQALLDKHFGANTRPTQKQQRRLRRGYVYLFSRSIDNATKIGFSVDPQQRATQIENSEGYEVEVIFTIPTDDMWGLEYKLHSQFEDKRRGATEWFDLTSSDIEAVCSSENGNHG